MIVQCLMITMHETFFLRWITLHVLVLLHNPDIVTIVESWLCEEITDNEVALSWAIRLSGVYDCNRRDGGGIVYVSDMMEG